MTERRKDEKMVIDLEDSAALLEGEKADYFCAEADRVFISEIKKKRA